MPGSVSPRTKTISAVFLSFIEYPSWLTFIEWHVDVWVDVWTDSPMDRCLQGPVHVAMSNMSVLNSPTPWLGRDNELIPSVPGGDEN